MRLGLAHEIGLVLGEEAGNLDGHGRVLSRVDSADTYGGLAPRTASVNEPRLSMRLGRSRVLHVVEPVAGHEPGE